jgi:Fe-S cluster assembly protein SufD
MQLADLPTRRNEAWKYSDLRAALAGAALPADVKPAPPQGKLDGVIDRLALGQGHHAVTTVQAGKSELLVERLDMQALSASVREIKVLPGASLTRVVIQSSAQNSVVLDSAHVSVSEGAQFRQFVLAEGATLARVETHVRVEGEGAHVELNGAYLCGAGRHADLTSTIEHKVGGCTTNQLIKGVALKGGRGVFQGKIVVDHGAQKTDARQHHHGMLLEDGAEIFAKPELMIHADDVQCAHGNAIGGLDQNALFYMRTRGIPEVEARVLLIAAFVYQTIPEGLPELLEQELASRISYWLREAWS